MAEHAFFTDLSGCLERIELSTSALMLTVEALYNASVAANVVHPADYIGKDSNSASIYRAAKTEKVFEGGELATTAAGLAISLTAGKYAMLGIKEFREKYKAYGAKELADKILKTSSPLQQADAFIVLMDGSKMI